MFFWGISPSSALVREMLLRALGSGGSARWPIAGVCPLSAEVRGSHLGHICADPDLRCFRTKVRYRCLDLHFQVAQGEERRRRRACPRVNSAPGALYVGLALPPFTLAWPLPAEVSALGLWLGTPGSRRSWGPSVQTRLGEALPA